MPESEQSAAARPPGADPRLTTIGIVVTVVWLALLAGYLWWKREPVLVLKPNELGDFFAGAFAPLAFFWLVLGFFQQGQELRHSGEALWLQGRELQQSVEQQRELVNVTREQLKLDGEMLDAQRQEQARTAMPILELGLGMTIRSDDFTQHFLLRNHGKPCTRVVLRGFDQTHQADTLSSAKPLEFDVKLALWSEARTFPVEVSFFDARSMPGAATFTAHWNGTAFTVIDAGEAGMGQGGPRRHDDRG